jgi:hypothetical protein
MKSESRQVEREGWGSVGMRGTCWVDKKKQGVLFLIVIAAIDATYITLLKK